MTGEPKGRKIDLRRIEEASLNAWPAVQEILLDGWLLRFAGGYTKRSNSVTALYPGTLDVEAKIDACEAHYAARDLPTIFRITPFADPEDLDERLAHRGYREIDPTLVLGIDLERWLEASGEGGPSPSMLRSQPLDDWQELYEAFAGKLLPRVHTTLVTSIPVRGALRLKLGCLEHAGRLVSCGIGVIEEPYLGLFSLITDPVLRRRGYGRATVDGLLGWGMTEGARFAYLQVEADNEPARRLYDRVGFCELYRYWYRVKGAAPA